MSEGDYMASMNPVGWIPQQALSLPDLWEALGRHHPPGHPVSYYMILVIFFEETAFCDISQLGTSGNLGCGFGQLEMSNPEKLPFYAWADLPLDYKKVAAGMLISKEYAVKVHCKYFQYLTDMMGMGLEGCLHGQVGSHTSYIPLFYKGAQMLEQAMNAGNRVDCINALKYAREKGPKANNIPFREPYLDFWKFILPENYLRLGF